MATWNITSPRIGAQPIATTDTTKRHNLGAVALANDPLLGEAEFIYLQGIGSTVVGSWVIWDGAFLTALLPANASSLTNPGDSVAVAMSANVASQYGWYMRRGATSVIKSATVGSGVRFFTCSAAGAVKTVTTSGQFIEGVKTLVSTIGSANSATTAATDTVVAYLDYPRISGVPPAVTG